MKIIIANYRTGSSVFARSIGGDGNEYLHSKTRAVTGFVGPTKNTHVYKVMPDQFGFEDYYSKFRDLYLRPTEKIYYTVRRDFNAQITSHLYAGLSFDWHPWQQIAPDGLYPKDWGKRINPMFNTDLPLHLQQAEMVKFASNFAKMDLKNLKWQAMIYKEFGGELVWLEDNFDEKVKYKRRKHINLPKLDFSVDVEGFFNE